MNSLALQDTFEPSGEDRKSTFGSIDPVAVERALQIAQRMEAARKTQLEVCVSADEEGSNRSF